jgi:hypothetical protein
VLATWLQDFESLEEISSNESARRIFLRMAELRRTGRIGSFLDELDAAADVDAETKGSLSELAQNGAFLFALEDYCEKTDRLH